jgi:hypothetical protein
MMVVTHSRNIYDTKQGNKKKDSVCYRNIPAVFKLHANSVLNYHNWYFTIHEQSRAAQTLNFAHNLLYIRSFHKISQQIIGSQTKLTFTICHDTMS